MKVRIDNKIKDISSLWWDSKNGLQMIDQRKLPFVFEIYSAKSVEDVCFAIKDMVVRGAPLIGVTGAYGLVLEALHFKGDNFEHFKKVMKEASKKLLQTRPTAVDLSNIQIRMLVLLESLKSVSELQQQFLSLANIIRDEIIAECRKIGEIGNQLIAKKHTNIMTICNAGALATVDIGTALAPIRKAHQDGKKLTVYVPETRPRVQGGRLTAWELENEGIDHTIIVDSAMGYYVKEGKIDLVITGADRICYNGDTANKIGTYLLSLACKENNIPFYVAAPISTFDLSKTADSFTIENRLGMEVQSVLSVEDKNDNNPKRRIIHNLSSNNLNPAFDVTPNQNITGFITPRGIIKQPYDKNIRKLLGK
ncbi:MAG: S-methyl-5-thioribose-1-phosphate isomerase [Asgard group archaeon]|nr:S-methyl-5-thioribose-1-phosphate isomerase [Asgard group archaeon]